MEREMRLKEIKEMLKDFLYGDEEEAPLDYEDLMIIYDELCKGELK